MNKADELRCAIIDRVSACTSERELDLILRFVRGIVEPKGPIDTRRRIMTMLGEITSENLLNRIYRFVKYIYLHRDGKGAAV